jgi:hypothetical protein
MAVSASGSYYKPVTPVKPPASALALAASGSPSTGNPFGFQTAKNTTGYGAAAPPTVSPVKTAATSPVIPKPAATTAPTVSALAPSAIQQSQTVAPTPGGYDINTDPALQGIVALTGESDDQAQADALRQKQQLLEGYGDPTLAQAVLGDPTVAGIAGQNPTSTVAQLKSQYGRNTQNLDEQLNQQNLLYSGYRVNQQQQAAEDYQNQLANAANQVNSGLSTVGSNLAAALGANQAQRVQAMNDAAARAIQAAIANGTAGGTGAPSSPAASVDTGGGGGGDEASSSSAPIPQAPGTNFATPALLNSLAAAAALPASAFTSTPSSAFSGIEALAAALNKPKSGYATASQLH